MLIRLSVFLFCLKSNEANWIENAPLVVENSLEFYHHIGKYSNSIQKVKQMVWMLVCSSRLQLEFYNSFVTNSACECESNDQSKFGIVLFPIRYYISTSPKLDVHAMQCNCKKRCIAHFSRWSALRSVCKFHLILSIRFFIGSNEQFTKI